MDTLDIREEEDALVLAVHGNLDAGLVQRYWSTALEQLGRRPAGRVRVDGRDAATCDGSGIAFLLALRQQQ